LKGVCRHFSTPKEQWLNGSAEETIIIIIIMLVY
jgi:hypothetical protein